MNIKDFKKNQILEICISLLDDYRSYLDSAELNIINSIYKNIDTIKVKELNNLLLPILEKIWNIELNSGNYIVVSWNKHNNKRKDDIVVFATLSKKDNIKSFCDLNNGIEYRISYKAIIGALPKDGATLIENIDKKNEYTLKIIKDKVINSYNGATKYITPMQLVKSKNKYNELILDSRYIEEIGEFIIKEEIDENELYNLINKNKIRKLVYENRRF